MADPDWTLSTIPDYKSNHQPMGYDEISSHYKKYVVVGAKITLYPIETSGISTSTSIGQYGILLDNDPHLLAGQNNAQVIENGYKFMRFGSYRNFYGGARSVGKLTCTYSAKKFFKTKSLVGQSEYERDVGAILTADDQDDTSKNAYFIIWVANNAGVENPPTQPWCAIIQYYVVWTDPVLLSQS